MTLLKLQDAFYEVTRVKPPSGHTTVDQFNKWMSGPVFRQFAEAVTAKAATSEY